MIHLKVTGRSEIWWGKHHETTVFGLHCFNKYDWDSTHFKYRQFFCWQSWLSTDIFHKIFIWELTQFLYSQRCHWCKMHCLIICAVLAFQDKNSRNFTCVYYIISNTKLVLTTNSSRFCFLVVQVVPFQNQCVDICRISVCPLYCLANEAWLSWDEFCGLTIRSRPGKNQRVRAQT